MLRMQLFACNALNIFGELKIEAPNEFQYVAYHRAHRQSSHLCILQQNLDPRLTINVKLEGIITDLF